MNIKYWLEWIKEIGIKNTVKYFLNKKIGLFNKEIWRITSRTLDDGIYVRPGTTDITLLECFFINTRSGIPGYDAEQYNIDFTNKLHKSVEYIIDAGANIGLFSLLYKQKFPKSKIIAIEPEDDNYSLLQMNISGKNDIYALRGGVWDKQCRLKVEDGHTGNWGYMVKETDSDDDDNIPAFSIINIIELFSIPHIDILKMDIEGSEYQVFSDDSCETWLSKVGCLIIETHDDKVNLPCKRTVHKRMTDLGFIVEEYGEDRVYYKQT